jgi:LysR family hydrogen peroxide-inducible transcriptional activator
MRYASFPVSLRQIQYAVAVADTLSFRRAAERCFVSQPALSAQLGELETALGLSLFERDKKRVLLNPGAAPLIERMRALLLEADDLFSTAQNLKDPLSGTLRLGVIPTVSQYWLPDASRTLKKKFPRLTVVWTEEKTDVLLQRLNAGELDAALLALESDLGDLEQAVIARDPFVLAMPLKHPLASSDKPISMSALAGEPMLLLDEGHCLREQALAACKNTNIEERGFRATSLPTLAQMVGSGAGITFLPSIAVETERKRGALATRSLANPVPFRTLGFAWRKSSPARGALQALAHALKDSK